MTSSVVETRPNLIGIWWRTLRPKTLTAALAPVAVGTAIAHAQDGLQWLYALLALLGALAIQVGTNFANDYFDFVKGADTETRTGPKRATQSGWVTPRTMKRATFLAFAFATLFGGALMWRGGWPIVVIGALSIASGVLYTGGPKPLAYVGLGDLFVLVFFGPVAVCGTVYVQTLLFSWTAFWSGIALGLLATAILCVNNVRDAHTDVVAGKRTLAVRFGENLVRAEYVLCLVGAYSVAAWLSMSRPLCALTFTTLPLAMMFTRGVYKNEKEALNPFLGKTGALLMIFSVLLCLGFVL